METWVFSLWLLRKNKLVTRPLNYRKPNKWDIIYCSDNCSAKATSKLQLDLVL